MTNNKPDIYFDEPVVTSFFIGEWGWLLQYYQAYMRMLKKEKYSDRKFLILTDLSSHVIFKDFAAITMGLPDWFYALNLERDCMESPLPESPAGSLTPPKVYSDLIEYFRQFYNVDKAIEVWSPRGCNQYAKSRLQLFCKYVSEPIENDRPFITIFPRHRERAASRNVPTSVWLGVVENLKQVFTVVLAGTPSGACLGDYKDDNVINLINYDEEDKTDKVIQYLNSSVCSISSQSGGTHISLLSGCPSYIIGHEEYRHTKELNRLDTPTTFRSVPGDYRAISADMILNDVSNFLSTLRKSGYMEVINRISLRGLVGREKLIGVEIGVYRADNSLNILRNFGIEKLYLVDPYENYAGQTLDIKTADEIKEEARKKVEHHNDKIEWIYKKSEDAHTEIPNELDFVYIDGSHKYEDIKKDIELYFPKVKQGGIVSGHDFDEADDNNGVIQAVTEFFGERNIEVFTGYGRDSQDSADWWVVVPSEFDDVLKADAEILSELIDKSMR